MIFICPPGFSAIRRQLNLPSIPYNILIKSSGQIHRIFITTHFNIPLVGPGWWENLARRGASRTQNSGRLWNDKGFGKRYVWKSCSGPRSKRRWCDGGYQNLEEGCYFAEGGTFYCLGCNNVINFWNWYNAFCNILHLCISLCLLWIFSVIFSSSSPVFFFVFF